MMKYGIVGNRKGWTEQRVEEVLDQLNIKSTDTMISGGAEGVDTFTQEYAKSRGRSILIHYPKPEEPSPDRYFNRNKQIATECDVLIAFDKGSNGRSGTLNTINNAKKQGKEVRVYAE